MKESFYYASAVPDKPRRQQVNTVFRDREKSCLAVGGFFGFIRKSDLTDAFFDSCDKRNVSRHHRKVAARTS